MSDCLGHGILRMTPCVMVFIVSPANLALDQAKRKSAAEAPGSDGSIDAPSLENMRQIAVPGYAAMTGLSSCTAQNFSLILMHCSIILVMFGMDSRGRNHFEAR